MQHYEPSNSNINAKVLCGHFQFKVIIWNLNDEGERESI